jgi:hypothetical protein
MAALQTEDPSKFREVLNGDALTVAFLGFENRQPTLIVLAFLVKLSADNTVQMEAQRWTFHNDYFLILGESDAAYALEESEPKFWSKGLVASATRLVQAEIAAKPDMVGPPIDILVITRNKLNWIKRKPECN